MSEHTRKKLIQFLENSQQYTAENILSNFPTDNLLEERAIILGRLGKHEQALTIYVRALGDINKATDYCKKVYEKELPGSQGVSIYIFLYADHLDKIRIIPVIKLVLAVDRLLQEILV